MRDHEIRSNVHSLVFFGIFFSCMLSKQFDDHIAIAVTGGIEMDTDM